MLGQLDPLSLILSVLRDCSGRDWIGNEQGAIVASKISTRMSGESGEAEYVRIYGRKTQIDADIAWHIKEGYLEFDRVSRLLYVTDIGIDWLKQQKCNGVTHWC